MAQTGERNQSLQKVIDSARDRGKGPIRTTTFLELGPGGPRSGVTVSVENKTEATVVLRKPSPPTVEKAVAQKRNLEKTLRRRGFLVED